MAVNTWGPRKPGTVYYILGKCQGRPAIKIGITSQRAADRARQVKGRLLAAQPGNGAIEAALHRRFSPVSLGHEWFTPTVELLLHIASIDGVNESQDRLVRQDSTWPDW